MKSQFLIQRESPDKEWVQCATADNEVIAYRVVKERTHKEGTRFRITDKQGRIYYTSETFGIKPKPQPQQESLQEYLEEWFGHEHLEASRNIEEVKRQISKLRRSGKSNKEISETTGISQERVSNLSGQKAIDHPGHKYKKNEAASIKTNNPDTPTNQKEEGEFLSRKASQEKSTKTNKAGGYSEVIFDYPPREFLEALLSIDDSSLYTEAYHVNAIRRYISKNKELKANEIMLLTQKLIQKEEQCSLQGLYGNSKKYKEHTTKPRKRKRSRSDIKRDGILAAIYCLLFLIILILICVYIGMLTA